MPNWCDNYVVLKNSDSSKIDALEKELQKESPEVCNHLRPNPAGEWDYDWSVANWGTKWDMSVRDWGRNNPNEIWISFDSAWAPPVTLYEFLEENDWEVSGLYHEPGMGFAGKYEDGYDDYYEFDYSERSEVEKLPEEILEFTNAMEDLENWEEENEAEAAADVTD